MMEFLFFAAMLLVVGGVLFALDKSEHRARRKHIADAIERLLIDYTNALRLRGHTISREEEQLCVEVALESSRRESLTPPAP